MLDDRQPDALTLSLASMTVLHQLFAATTLTEMHQCISRHLRNLAHNASFQQQVASISKTISFG